MSRPRSGFRYTISRTIGGGTYWAPGNDCSAVINQALTDAAASGTQKPWVHLLDGQFPCASSIVIPDAPNMRLKGQGKDNTTLLFSNLTSTLVGKAAPTTQRYKYRVEGLTIDNQSKANVGAIGLDVQNLSNSTFTDLVITNVETAIRLKGLAYFNRFLDIDIEECTYGEVFTAAADGTTFPNENSFFAVKHAKAGSGTGVDYPVVLNGGNDNHWTTCSFEDFLVGIDLSDLGNTFTNCRIECNDRTGTVIYIRFNTGANNNGFLNCYFSGNKWVSRTTSIVDNGAGNSILALSNFKDQFFRGERNALTADDVMYMKRSGSGDGKAVYVADDTYANSGSPIGFLAKHVRSTGKFFSGLLNGVEKFFVDANGNGMFAGHLAVGGAVDNQWGPSAYGYKSWTYDPIAITQGSAPTGGVMQVVALRLSQTTTISKIWMNLSTAGNGVTAAYAALYSSAGALLAQSDDQSANMTTTGIKTFTLSTPQTVAAGTVYVAFWSTATTTQPTWSRAAGVGVMNQHLTPARYATADTGLTTTAPATIGARTSAAIAWWLAVD